ncbi:hypothetical protein HY604_01405, partial [Candidatus Peregrinibacteria bacterium]|nr:hypothetical protein [Candidatus Peregrinibacteria bacterium]
MKKTFFIGFLLLNFSFFGSVNAEQMPFFTDVDENDANYDAISYLYKN